MNLKTKRKRLYRGPALIHTGDGGIVIIIETESLYENVEDFLDIQYIRGHVHLLVIL